MTDSARARENVPPRPKPPKRPQRGAPSHAERGLPPPRESPIGIRFTTENKQLLERRAARTGTSRSDVANEMLDEWRARHEAGAEAGE